MDLFWEFVFFSQFDRSDWMFLCGLNLLYVMFFSYGFQFNIPNLRVGTLDSLLALSDDLLKASCFILSADLV